MIESTTEIHDLILKLSKLNIDGTFDEDIEALQKLLEERQLLNRL